MKYKLTDENMKTYGDFQWEIGKKVITSGNGTLCSNGWVHFYHCPLLAILLNPCHAAFNNPRLFECKIGKRQLNDSGLKGGTTELILTKEIQVPQITDTQRIAFGILCVKAICDNRKWNQWADKWLLKKDRTEKSAYVAYDNTAYNSASAYATYAAYVYAAAYTYAGVAGYIYARTYAANAAIIASTAKKTILQNFNLKKIAKECLKY